MARMGAKFGHLILPVDDMDEALRFYLEGLGFHIVGDRNPVWTVVDAKGVALTLFRQPKAPRVAMGRKKDDTPVHLHVRNVVEAAQALRKQGYRVRRSGLHSGVAWDPAGNAIGLHDHRRVRAN